MPLLWLHLFLRHLVRYLRVIIYKPKRQILSHILDAEIPELVCHYFLLLLGHCLTLFSLRKVCKEEPDIMNCFISHRRHEKFQDRLLTLVKALHLSVEDKDDHIYMARYFLQIIDHIPHMFFIIILRCVKHSWGINYYEFIKLIIRTFLSAGFLTVTYFKIILLTS